jgi:hypothetical protein
MSEGLKQALDPVALTVLQRGIPHPVPGSFSRLPVTSLQIPQFFCSELHFRSLRPVRDSICRGQL